MEYLKLLKTIKLLKVINMKKILFIGCGNMGSAIVKSMLISPYFARENIEVVLPNDSPHYKMVLEELKLKVHESYPLGAVYDAILFAVKPQILPEILPYYQNFIAGLPTMVVSIAAGKTIGYFEKFFPNLPIIRVMPNINILAGRGAAAAVHNSKTNPLQLELIEHIFAKSGYFTWLEDESLIDVVVATSGSSPAYYFLFTEFLARLGSEHGLAPDVSLKLAEEAFIGSALIKSESGKPLADLRSMVTSAKGTTYAALQAFENDDKLYKVLKSAFEAAIKRSQELSE
jgi:pyrroline-5-carboxylate reductase